MDQAEDELAKLEQLLGQETLDVVSSQPSENVSNRAVEIDIFSMEAVDDSTRLVNSNTVIHNGDTDSSEDEEKRSCFKKYNSYGSDIKKILQDKETEKYEKQIEFKARLLEANNQTRLLKTVSQTIPNEDSQKSSMLPPKSVKDHETKNMSDIFAEPIFGIRVIMPLVSSDSLEERMRGRDTVPLSRVKRHTECGDLNNDWVVGGVIVRKSATKQSQKGSQFTIWTLSDLKGDLKTISVFLFRSAYQDLWKTIVGTVVFILNPKVLDRRNDSADQACLSVDSKDRVMIIGKSKDLGFCKSTKKNGEPCTSFINKDQCEHCIYHVKQEYQKYSRRQELQSSTMGKGLINLQNKVLGKNTVIFGGKSYSAIPKANNKAIAQRDQDRLMRLSDYYKDDNGFKVNKLPSGYPLKQNAVTLETRGQNHRKDLERLRKLQSSPSLPSHTSPGRQINTSPENNISRQVSLTTSKLSSNVREFSLKGQGIIDLNVSYGKQDVDRAKSNALNWIKSNGPIKKIDPHNLKGTETGRKRVIDELNKSDNNENESQAKVPKKEECKNRFISERFKKIMEATSRHQNLLEQYDNSEEEKYFNKLEKKESLEEKMLNTFKVACKAVKCTKCHYTSFSAADKCKEERHPLKVFDAFKRFFKCLDCGNRTVVLTVVPLIACSNCRSSRWTKAPMIREKKCTTSEALSIRGEEETFLGSMGKAKPNINLLVPEENTPES